MAPRNETTSRYSRRLLPCIPKSWPLLALCAAAGAFTGMIFFIVGLIGALQPSYGSKARDWVFLALGITLLASGISLFLLCRIRATSTRYSRSRRRRRGTTRPLSRREPLPVWTVDAIDPSFRPPPTYSEAIQCSRHSPTRPPTLTPIAVRPPAYSPTPNRQSRMTDV